MHTTTFFRSAAGVFQGGGCRAAAFVGAYSEAVKRGVSFTEVSGTSAGSIVAALIGAGATPHDLESAINDLDFKSFLSPPEPQTKRGVIAGKVFDQLSTKFAALYYDQGFYSSARVAGWVDQQLNRLLPNVPHPVTFQSLPTPTYIVSTDLVRTEPKVWSSKATPNELVSLAVQASCAIPIFFQPVERRYVDGGVLSNLPAFVFSDNEVSDRPLSTRVLAFSLDAHEEPQQNWDTGYFLNLLISAIIDGSQKLQLSQHRTVHVIKIPTGKIKATDFELMTPQATKQLIFNGTEATQKFFNEELQRVRSPKPAESICHGVEEVYTHVTDGLEMPLNRVVIAENDTAWVYSLFPTILCWRMQNVEVDVLLPQYGDKEGDGQYRRKLLRALGVRVTEIPSASAVPLRAYVLDATDAGRSKAIVGVNKSYQTQGIEAAVYAGLIDAGVIRSVLHSIDASMQKGGGAVDHRPSFSVGGQDRLLQSLKSVGQYARSGVDLAVENVPMDRLVSLTRYVREYKYKQIHHLIKQYSRNDMPLFVPASVNLSDGRLSLLTPPVVEVSGDRFVLIEGSTRATYCRDNHISDSLRCVVVRNVRDPLPSEAVPFREVRVVARTLAAAQRYEGFSYANFRPIENSVHPLDSLD